MGIACHEYPDDMAVNTRPLIEHEVYSADQAFMNGVSVASVTMDTVVVGSRPIFSLSLQKTSLSQTIV